MATLEVRSLSRTYPGDVAAISDVSIAVREGRICAVVGPLGSGKTTLLRLVAGLDPPDAGDVFIDGLSILDRPPHRRGVGLMFEDLALFPHMTVRENIAFGLRMVGWLRVEREQRVSDLMEVVGLATLGARSVGALTGDERQRVALARTLAPQPSVLLLDEPVGLMDEAKKAALRLELRSILSALETTALVATDDLRDAIAIADDLVLMNGGRVLQQGPVGVVLGEPASVEVAELVGYVTLAHGPVRRGRVEEASVGAMPVPGLPDAEAVRVMAHPAALLGVPPDSGLGSGIAGLVLRSRAQGPMWLVDLLVGGRVIEVRWEWDLVPPRVGSRLTIAARPGTLRIFGSSLAALPMPTVPAAPSTGMASAAPIEEGAPTTPTTAAEPATPTAPHLADATQETAAPSPAPRTRLALMTRSSERIADPSTHIEQHHREMPLH